MSARRQVAAERESPERPGARARRTCGKPRSIRRGRVEHERERLLFGDVAIVGLPTAAWPEHQSGAAAHDGNGADAALGTLELGQERPHFFGRRRCFERGGPPASGVVSWKTVRFVFVGAGFLVVIACGGESRSIRGDGSGAGGSVGSAGTGAGGGGNAGSGRAPAHHRAASPDACPQERGSSEPAPEECTGSPTRECEQDGDCTDGTQGRCLRFRVGCLVACSYDECATDADCPDDEPCECRASPTDVRANRCVASGNCRIDSDCGVGGYCSPSHLGEVCACRSVDYCETVGSPCDPPDSCACGDSCGHAYYCHTPNDTCLDDSDCTGGATCSFDLAHENWACAVCGPVP